MSKRFSVEAVFRAVDKVTAPVTRMQNSVGKFSRKAQRWVRKVDRGFGKLVSGIKRGSAIVVVALASTTFAMAGMVGAGANFEQAIVDVGAVSLKTRDQIQPLEKLALELGRTTRFTATQAANAMEVMSRAGFSVNEILSATPAVLSAAAASGLEIAEVADVVSNALKGMGLDTSQAAKVADLLALASARTNSSIGSLGESLKNVASTAKQLGIPIEEVVASVALLQDVGLEASEAGSAFNTMLTKMAAPTKSITKKMERFGISFKDAKGDMLPLGKVLDQLNIASKKAGGNFDKVAFFAELVGLRGQRAAANLSDLFESGKLEILLRELQKSKDVADKMARLRMDTFQGSLLLLGSAVDSVKVKMFNLQGGTLKDLVDRMTEWVGVNQDVIASGISEFLIYIIENAEELVTLLGEVALGVASIIALSLALKLVAAAIVVINFLLSKNPIVLAITAAIIAVGYLLGALDPVIAVIKSIGKGIGGAIDLVKSLTGFFDDSDNEKLLDPDAVSRADAARQLQTPTIITPQDRVAKTISDSTTTNNSEVTIRPANGVQAEVTKGRAGNGVVVLPTGAF